MISSRYFATMANSTVKPNQVFKHYKGNYYQIVDIAKHHDEIYKKVYTLCKKHHKKLHSLFGKAPLLQTATKQENWIEKQKAKYVAT